MRTYSAIMSLLVIAPLARAQSNIDPNNRFAWGENVGWTNWQHNRPDAGDGVAVTPNFLGGFIWGENVGWINVGDGSPADGVHYANVNGTDFGVNVAGDGELSGFAWGENVGWINFSGGAQADPPQPARIDDECRLRGYAWGENVGWLNLDVLEAGKHVELIESVRRGDMNCDCAMNNFDIDAFVLALSDPDAYHALFPDCNILLGDMNCDGAFNNFDIEGFVSCLSGGSCDCP